MIRLVLSTDTEVLALRTAVEGLPAGFGRVTAATTWAEDPIGDLDEVRCVLVRLLGGAGRGRRASTGSGPNAPGGASRCSPSRARRSPTPS